MLKQLAYIAALFRANWKAHHTDVKHTFVFSSFMLLQNALFFALWVIFFGAVRQIKGWQLADVAVMFGIFSSAIGLAMFAADGARTISLRLQDGSIDAFLTRPRHPLPALLLSRSGAASLGDFAFGPLLWFTFGGVEWAQTPKLLGLSLLSAIIVLATTLIFFSLAFWLKRGTRFCDQIFEALLIFSAVPQHNQLFGVKIVMFSILPAGFITLLPASLARHFDLFTLGLLCAAALFYSGLAVAVFNAGVRHYIADEDNL